MNNNLKLFLSAFTQTCLVAMNVVFIATGNIWFLIITGFGISYFWTYNVKRAAFATQIERIIYSVGACTGTLIGYFLASILK